MILLTGATGNTGGQVAVELRRRGVPFRALVRSEAARQRLRGLGYETVDGDLDRPETLPRALEAGYEKVYLVCTPDERMIPRECAMVDAAKAAGVRHVVKLSAFLAAPDAPTTNLRSHATIERHLMDSGLDWTILRPHGFMQTFVLFSLEFVLGAGLYLHAAGDGAMALVDVRDLGLAGAEALTGSGHAGKAYDITGPEGLGFAEQARILAEAFDRPVSYVKGDDADMGRAMKMLGVAPQSIEHATIIMQLCRQGGLGQTTDALARLGVQPRTFAEFARDLAAGRTGGGNSFVPPDTFAIRAMKRAMIWGYRARFALLGRPG